MRAPAATVLLAATFGCARAAPDPVLVAVEPVAVRNDADARLALLGQHLAPAVRADFDSPASSQVRADFRVDLVSGSARIALADVALVSEGRVEASLPAGAAPGRYGVELRDPRGRLAALADALQVYAPECLTEGAPCEDGNPCTTPDVCLSRTCVSGPFACAPDTAPLACLAVAPTSGVTGATAFTADASCSKDLEDDKAGIPLQARFDFESDGAWDTPFSPAKSAIHSYPSAGLWSATAEVRDSGGLSTFARRLVAVLGAGEEVLVTTGDDAGAGSLRAAIQQVNGAGSPRAIAFAGPFRIALASPLPDLVADGAAIVGRPDVTVECPAAATSCLRLRGSAQKVVGLSLRGGRGTALQLDGAGYLVAECAITKGPSILEKGIDAGAPGVIGPGNDVSGAQIGVRVDASGAVVDGNRIHHNLAGGLFFRRDGAVVRRNVVYANRGPGIVAVQAIGGRLQHNTVDGNEGDGLSALAGVELDVRGNLFTRNQGYGIGAVPGTVLSPLDHDGFFANAAGDLSNGAPGPTDVTADPFYVNRAEGDLRLLPGSPAANAGADLGLDLNGPRPGNWDGAAPDLGAWESPY